METSTSDWAALADQAGRQDAYRLSRHWLFPSFRHKSVERRFVAEFNAGAIWSCRIWIAFIVIMWVAFAAIDVRLADPQRQHVLWFRLGISTPILIAALVFTFSRHAALLYQPLVALVAGTIQGGLMYVIAKYDVVRVTTSLNLDLPMPASDGQFLFVVVWLLVIFISMALVRLLTVTAIASAAGLLLWTGLAVWIHRPSAIVLVAVTPFMLASLAAGGLGSLFVQRYARDNFRTKHLLAAEGKRLSEAYAALEEYADHIRRELALAKEVQEKLLPDREHMPLAARIEWASSFVPASEVAGDYFDAAETNDGKVAMVLADVSGHGMGAALVTVILKTAFQVWVERDKSLADFVDGANRALCRLTPEGNFVVLIAAVYDHANGRLDYVNCGHDPEPIYVPSDPSQPAVRLAERGAMLLGLQEDIAVAESTQAVVSGDKVFLATDGVTEARNSDRGFYGKERLGQFLQTHRAMNTEDLVSALVANVSSFSVGIEQSDDQTVLAFSVR